MKKVGLDRSTGFTLIELMVVISIIAIMAAAAIPFGINWARNYKLIGAAQNVGGQMQASRAQAVKRNTQRGILLNFNYPGTGRYQYTSLDPDPRTGTWDGGVYPNFNPLSYTEGLLNYGAVPAPPDNILDPDPALGVMSPHGTPLDLPAGLQFDPGAFNALLFRADGSVRAVNTAGGGAGVVNVVGVNFQLAIHDPNTDLIRTVTISQNGRVVVQR